MLLALTAVSRTDLHSCISPRNTFEYYGIAGLGLYLAALMVKHLGSELEITSPYADSQGTCFHFTKKLQRSQNSAGMLTNLRADSLRISDLGQQRLTQLRVLICDDESINCKILVRKLQQPPIQELNWEAHTALTLADCLAKCLDQPFDLIFMDEHFAGTATTGSQYISTLRHRGVHTPVLMASANCSDADKGLYLSR